jgi:hypothetical protein
MIPSYQLLAAHASAGAGQPLARPGNDNTAYGWTDDPAFWEPVEGDDE